MHLWRAWKDLDAGRGYVSLGMGGCVPLPIAFSEIKSWLELAEVESREERRDIVETVRALDGVFMRWQAEKVRG